MATLLDIQGLSVERGGVCILDGIDWRVRAGEHWALVGPNGCGKTALLNCILAYMDMGAGRVELFGQRYGASDWQTLRKRVGLVSMGIARQLQGQDRADHIVCSGAKGHLTCFAPPAPRRLTKARRRLRELGCEAIAGRPWRVLSQGERSRVLIARAMMAEPKLLILDEPCTGLDPVAREHYLRELEALMQRPSGPAVVMVSHHLEEIVPAVTHVLLMRDGRALHAGPKTRVLRDEAVSACFGAPVRVRRRGGRYRLALADD